MPLAFSLYQFSLGLHAVFAISFLGVAGANGVIGPMSRENPQHALFALKVSEKIHKTAVIPGMIGILVTGIYQSAKGPWGSGDWWLTIGVVLFLVMVFISLFILHPANKVAQAELEAQTEPGPPSAAFQQAVLRHTKEAFFCLDATKLGRVTPHRVAEWSGPGTLVTDATPAQLAAAGLILPPERLITSR